MRRFKPLAVALACAVTLQAFAQALAPGAGEASSTSAHARRAAEEIKASDLRSYLHFVASDEMEGRDTPSRGLDLAAKFLAMNLSLWGVRPAGDDGTYFQRIALRRTRVDPSASRAEVGGQSFEHGAGFYDNTPAGGDFKDAPLIYVGHGWLVRSKNINPYEGIDVRGKVLVVAGGGFLPREAGAGVSMLGAAGADWMHPYEYAVRHGARAVVAMPTARTLSKWERARRRPQTPREHLAVERFESGDGANLIPVLYEGATGELGINSGRRASVPFITASVAMLDKIFEGERRTAAELLRLAAEGARAESFELSPNKRLSLTVAAREERVMTQNVVGIIEGSDPVLKDEFVAVGAHYDHVGVEPSAAAQAAAGGDRIYNGADDDGSGTVAVLELAHAFATASPRPKRSILLVWHAGEEKGLWGSRYFVENPTVPLARVVAQLNIDMIGRSKRAGDVSKDNEQLTGPEEIYVIGSKKMSAELGALSERVNTSYLGLKFNYRYDDPADPERFFYRSDHFHYARKGVPIIFYFDGPHEDYHKLSDHADKIDYAKMEKVARTVFVTAWELASAPARPRVDKPLPPDVADGKE
ncbi:MAG TPA: M20/M25/M40 family metallo-hydrolase [Pyrinomonadaceae bacterium]|nr:M20/M25/M40 family metallo-hydrolase [Pyrinomonadaceae bacterium]